MSISFIANIFKEASDREALVWKDKSITYSWLQQQSAHWRNYLDSHGVRAGFVVMLQGEFSPNSIAMLLALIEQGCIVVPIIRGRTNEIVELTEIGMIQILINVDETDAVKMCSRDSSANHELYRILRERNHPGLVLFSSGSTGKSKAVVHDLVMLLKKYNVRRHDLRTVAFLLFDHIGGFDTLFYCLSNGSALIIPDDRNPESVCLAVERHHAEVLPVSPSFLNLVLLSEAYLHYDLSSLKYITYGAEVMPMETLRRCAAVFPNVRLLQKYGTTEIGTMRSRSEDPASVWVKIGGEGYKWRVIDGMLQVKAESAMLGYLNARSPFSPDGWFNTGDCVEVEGDYLKILGRKSDIINVAGQKVYPAEVEDFICQMDNVADATVYGEKNQLLGNVVCAKVKLINSEPLDQFLGKLKQHCKGRIEKYKVPLKVMLSEEPQADARSKKPRLLLSSAGENAHDKKTRDTH